MMSFTLAEKKIDERKKIVEAVEDATEALKQDRKEFGKFREFYFLKQRGFR